jgi:SAM-dependent methyltransferase
MIENDLHPSTREYIEKEIIATEYDQYYLNDKLFEFDVSFLRELFKEPGTLLDLGCGTGRHIIYFAQRGFSVVGVDLSKHMLKVAKKKLNKEALKGSLIRGDIARLDFLKKSSFDYTICMYSTLGMVKGSERRQRVVEGVSRALKFNGLAVFHVYQRFLGEIGAFFDLKWLLKRLGLKDSELESGDLILKEFRGIKNFYIHFFTLSEIKDLFKKAGMCVQRVIYLNDEENGEYGGFLKRFFARSIFVVALKGERGIDKLKHLG